MEEVIIEVVKTFYHPSTANRLPQALVLKYAMRIKESNMTIRVLRYLTNR